LELTTDSYFIEVTAEKDFVTHGEGVSLMPMRNPHEASGRVGVDRGQG